VKSEKRGKPTLIRNIHNEPKVENGQKVNVTVITLGEKVPASVFVHILEFLYTGVASIVGGSTSATDIIPIAEAFECAELVTICQNILEGNEDLNPSIGTWLNDKTADKLKQTFFKKAMLADFTFKVEGRIINGHKAVLKARSPVISAMFSGFFAESAHKEVVIEDASFDCFSAMLEYIYTEHAPIEDVDSLELLVLANRYGVNRLMTLCELYISKAVEVATRTDIIKAEIDIIGLFLCSQTHNAGQLEAFCRHFICVNFQLMKKRAEFANLKDDNLKYCEENQWPPLSYLKEVEDYERTILKMKDGDKNCIVM